MQVVPGHNTVETAEVDVGDHRQQVPVGVEMLDTSVSLEHMLTRLVKYILRS